MGGRSGWNSTSSRRRFTALFTMRAGNFPPAGTISRRLRYRLPTSSGPPFFLRTTAQRPAVPGSSRRQALICSAGGSGQGGSSSSHRRRPQGSADQGIETVPYVKRPVLPVADRHRLRQPSFAFGDFARKHQKVGVFRYGPGRNHDASRRCTLCPEI